MHVRLILELADESGGKLSFDGLAEMKRAVPAARVFYWPLEKRQKDSKGRHGIFHAKCLLVDNNFTLVSSAKAHRRKGVATALIRFLQNIAMSYNAWVIFVQADTSDKAAIKLYASLGRREDVHHFDIPVRIGLPHPEVR